MSGSQSAASPGKFKGKSPLLICVLAFSLLSLIVGIVLCFVMGGRFDLLQSQLAAERWRGEGELRYSQISCFLPAGKAMDVEAIYTFAATIYSKLSAASLEPGRDGRLLNDAWCAFDSLPVSSDKGNGTASVIAVGGDYFSFHPLRLLSGSYISDDDFTSDRVILDEELAWRLFGGTDLQGLTVNVSGAPFVVAGVISRETDFASKKAYSGGMGLYMLFDAWCSLTESSGVEYYELVLAEPVDGFALKTVKESFPVKDAEIIENTDRFSLNCLFRHIRDFDEHFVHRAPIAYPYWENAARILEARSALCLVLIILLFTLPAVSLIVLVFLLLRRLFLRI